MFRCVRRQKGIPRAWTRGHWVSQECYPQVHRPNQTKGQGKFVWLIMDSGLLDKEQPQEGIQEALPSIFCVMNELEKAEIDGKVLLGDPPVRP